MFYLENINSWSSASLFFIIGIYDIICIMSEYWLLVIITICVVTLSIAMVYIMYLFLQSYKKLQSTLDLIQETTNDVQVVKAGVKSGILSIVSVIIDGLQKGGEKKE
jgi:hypothetical protein